MFFQEVSNIIHYNYYNGLLFLSIYIKCLSILTINKNTNVYTSVKAWHKHRLYVIQLFWEIKFQISREFLSQLISDSLVSKIVSNAFFSHVKFGMFCSFSNLMIENTPLHECFFNIGYVFFLHSLLKILQKCFKHFYKDGVKMTTLNWMAST